MNYNLKNENVLSELLQDEAEKTRIGVLKVYRVLILWFAKEGKLIEKKNDYVVEMLDSDKEKIVKDMSENKTYNAIMAIIFKVNKIFKTLNYDIHFSKPKNLVAEFDLSKYLTHNEVISVCSKLTNAQDKFIIYAAFCGLIGKDAEDIRGIKIKDIDLEKRLIKLKDTEFKLDKLLSDFTKETLEQKEYKQYLEQDSNAAEFYLFNSNSEYLIKTKPDARYGNGLKEIGYSTIRKRLLIINDYLDNKVQLNFTNLKISGIMHQMQVNEKKYTQSGCWTNKSLKEFKEDNKLNFKIQEVLSIYKQKYIKE
ncbi:hypothetical protein QEW_0734 [Clostridioides difficile CD160]|uniref:hypothetical protein n=1 Tax=unclassified Clostridioides TaxID=2635829 RepID=UPI00038C9502|nr:hypothetical protein QEW_0734 [Clostridioides difficile CD160]MCC0642391.1 hypothetical protein [Clostridioides sp. ES-S-0049-03]MCC0678424.1 hypothetical protein [Clostridioides sp. ES-W-0018-02]MCC0713251.1 hypothetical protein [Clostridioides sp. ES-W-0017-02]MDI7817974.1 hypothetical protein [Clostridioides difficile]